MPEFGSRTRTRVRRMGVLPRQVGAWAHMRIAIAIAFALNLMPAVAHADDVEDFAVARDAYVSQNFEIAIQAFQNLLDRQPPIIPSLTAPTQRYLYAALLAAGHRDRAIAVLERVLRADPDVQFAPDEFSVLALQFVTETRTRMATELAQIRRDNDASAHAMSAARERRRLELLALLSRERVTVRVSRGWMFVPFGIGQFANGSYALGALFATLQSAALATAVSTYAVAASLRLPDRRPDQPDCRPSVCTPLIVANVAGWSAFALVAVVGIIQANVTWRPERTEFRTRPVPSDFERIQISAAPMPEGGSIMATGRF